MSAECEVCTFAVVGQHLVRQRQHRRALDCGLDATERPDDVARDLLPEASAVLGRHPDLRRLVAPQLGLLLVLVLSPDLLPVDRAGRAAEHVEPWHALPLQRHRAEAQHQ